MFIIVLTKRHKVIGCIDKLKSIINLSIVYYEIHVYKYFYWDTIVSRRTRFAYPSSKSGIELFSYIMHLQKINF
jgi:hypothetical protein